MKEETTMCIMCKGIKAITNKDYCGTCIIDTKEIEKLTWEAINKETKESITPMCNDCKTNIATHTFGLCVDCWRRLNANRV